MKSWRSLVLLTVIVLASVALLAQTKISIPAGTPEDKALNAVSGETDAQKKISMLEDFVQTYSSNPAAVAYGNWQLAQQYAASDPAKAMSYNDKALACDARCARHHSVAGRTVAAVEGHNQSRGLRCARRQNHQWTARRG